VSRDGVSVIIPARHAPLLPRVLESVLSPAHQTQLIEVIVISADEVVFGDERVKWLRTDQPQTAPVARNLGIQAAQGEWLAFIDADCLAAPQWLDRLLSAAQRGYRVVGGGVEFGRAAYWGDVHNVSMLHEFHVSAPSGPRRFLPTLNLLVQRSVYDEVGGMNEQFRRAQDLEWTARMTAHGIALWFEADAAVTHCPQRTRGSLWRDYRETGKASYQVRARSIEQQPLPHWLNTSRRLRVLSPIIAAAVTARIYLKRPALLKHLITAPGVWFTKLAWCFGAADAAEN
jgi:glycosyltransferase involved in cell wall biosynthesis